MRKKEREESGRKARIIYTTGGGVEGQAGVGRENPDNVWTGKRGRELMESTKVPWLHNSEYPDS
jgi:hypothetical protein